MNLKNISDKILLEETYKLVQEERKATAAILHHFQEIDFRKLHLQMGFSSLFDYATKELCYSESQAQRRISAMRLLRDLPEVESKIKTGTLSLTNAARIQSFIRQSSKERKPLSLAQKKNLIAQMENKSSRECELEFLKISPETIILKDTERILSENYIEIKVTIKKELKDKINRVKNLLSHKNPNPTMNELLELMCDQVLKEKDPLVQRRAYSAPKLPFKNQRYIAAQMKRKIWKRDKGCCSYKDHKTKRQCTSQHMLEVDHIKPIALGGTSSLDNLRLLCFQHHQMITEEIFGKWFNL